jgi:hypothetical protein
MLSIVKNYAMGLKLSKLVSDALSEALSECKSPCRRRNARVYEFVIAEVVDDKQKSGLIVKLTSQLQEENDCERKKQMPWTRRLQSRFKFWSGN